MAKALDEGCSMDESSVHGVENKLEQSPNDLYLRSALAAYYYFREDPLCPASKLKYGEHLLWIVENVPESEIAGFSVIFLKLHEMPEVVKTLSSVWLRHLRQGAGERVLVNALEFFSSLQLFELAELAIEVSTQVREIPQLQLETLLAELRYKRSNSVTDGIRVKICKWKIRLEKAMQEGDDALIAQVLGTLNELNAELLDSMQQPDS